MPYALNYETGEVVSREEAGMGDQPLLVLGDGSPKPYSLIDGVKTELTRHEVNAWFKRTMKH